MPLPDILKRRRSSLLEKTRKSASSSNPTSPVKQLTARRLPLEDLVLDQENEVFEHSSSSSCGPRLIKSLSDLLTNQHAVEYFSHFLETKHQKVSLVKFWIDVQQFHSRQQSPPSLLATDEVNERLASPSTDSFDSGINSHNSDSSSLTSPKAVAAENLQQKHHHHTFTISSHRSLKSLTEDALEIYQKYVSPDCPYPIDLSLEQKQDIIRGICTEDGQADLACFEAAQREVFRQLEQGFYPDFLSSSFYAKYQLQVFTCDGGSGVTIGGLLHNEMLLFHFMEFMESEGRSERGLLEFWMTANNFRQQFGNVTNNNSTAAGENSSTPDESFVQSDAVLIYEKFVSLQASTPLGFSSSIRSEIEEKICSVDGTVDPSCFDSALALVELVLQRNYLQKFLSSPLFGNYMSELISTVEKNPQHSRVHVSSTASHRHRSASGSSINTSCSSETLSSHTPSISAQNTLLASASKSKNKHNNNKHAGADFLDLSTNPDNLWRRKKTTLTNIGHVDHLGRYTSSFEAPPDSNDSGGGAKSHVYSGYPHQPTVRAKISKAVRKLVSNEDMERFREEMAWQMAEMIVSDVTTRALSGASGSQDMANLGLPQKVPTSTPNPRKKSKS